MTSLEMFASVSLLNPSFGAGKRNPTSLLGIKELSRTPGIEKVYLL